MKRSIEFPCDPRWIKNPTNSPLATIGMRMAVAARTKKAIAAVQAILSAHFTPPPGHCARLAPNGMPIGEVKDLMRANRWTVRLTRISPGTLDPLTGGASMKAIQDAVARWCGVPDERNPVWRWVEPIGQEKRGQGVYGVRIEIESLEPGEDRIVRLAGVEPRTPKGKRGRPTVGDLHAAAERVMGKRLGGLPGSWDVRAVPGGVEARGRSQDPGEEQAACMLVDCNSCGASRGEPCRGGGARVFNVHEVRAVMAGHERAVITERKTATGPRKPATVKPREAWAVLPWKSCSLCSGVLPESCPGCRMVVRWAAAEEQGAPAEVLMPVPAKHWGPCGLPTCTRRPFHVFEGLLPCRACEEREKRGEAIRMIRRPWRRAGVECWLYEPAA